MADALFAYVLTVGLLNGVVGSLRWRFWVSLPARARFVWLGAAALNLGWTIAAWELLTYPAPIASLGIRWFVAAMGVTWLLVAIMLDPAQRWWKARR